MLYDITGEKALPKIHGQVEMEIDIIEKHRDLKPSLGPPFQIQNSYG
jgi:hypothetical protein